MKIYHTETQADYNSLMRHLENRGYAWQCGSLPTKRNVWSINKNRTCVIVSKKIAFGTKRFCKNEFPGTEIIDYKRRSKK